MNRNASMPLSDGMTVVDGHVHVYPHVPVETALDIGFRNLEQLGGGRRDCMPMLLVADPPGVHLAARLCEAASSDKPIVPEWAIRSTSEAYSFLALRGDQRLVLVLGQQLATAEKLEVLSFGAAEVVLNGASIDETLAAIERSGGTGIVPWGVGKWSGRRGRLIERVLAEKRGDKFFLGDNGGRPKVWPVPQFALAQKLGIRVLRGTDPLPLTGDERRIASFGFGLAHAVDTEHPLESLLRILSDPSTQVLPLGRPVSVAQAIANQFRLRFAPVSADSA